MKRDAFHSAMESPERIDEKQLSSLKEVVNRFPYFQSARMLYLKGLHDQNDLSFSQELPKGSIYAADRIRLYELMKEEVRGEIGEASSKTDLTPNLLPTEDRDLAEELAIDNEKTSIEEIVAESNSNEPLEKQILEAAIAVSGIPELAGTEGAEPNELEDNPEPLSTEDIVAIEPSSESPASPPLRNSLLDWIKPDQPQSEPAKPRFDELYESFIQKDRTRIEEKEHFFSAEELGKKSVEDDSEKFVTETLAQIYINQGNYQKALEIYEKLLSDNPEKRLYFAVRIQNLERKIKEQ